MKVQQQKTRCRQNQQDDVLGSMLRDYYLEGCRISLEGKSMEPWEAASCCLRERVSYMMDFIPDPAGHRISRIDLNRVGADRYRYKSSYMTDRQKYGRKPEADAGQDTLKGFGRR